MRLARLFTSCLIASVLTLSSVGIAVAAGWVVDTDGDDADVTGRVWVDGKGRTPHNSVGGKKPGTYSKEAAKAYEALQRFCGQAGARLTSPDTNVQQTVTAEERASYASQCQSQPAPPPPPALLGAEAVAQLQLPAATPMVGPDPSWNRWKMIAIGFPIWLWSEGPNQLSSSASVRGYTVTLSATRVTTFSLGDGTLLSCTATTPYVRGQVSAHTVSPTCGHTYQRVSPAGGYRLAALSTWQVTWSVMGESGVIEVEKGATRQLVVGELQAVVVRQR